MYVRMTEFSSGNTGQRAGTLMKRDYNRAQVKKTMQSSLWIGRNTIAHVTPYTHARGEPRII